MKSDSDIHITNWDLLRQADEKGFYDCFHLCYDDLYRLGLFLYKDPELVKESIHLVFIELWKIKEKLLAVNNIKAYVITIFTRILYKQKNGSIHHWSKIEMIDAEKKYDEGYTLAYEEMLIGTEEDHLARKRMALLLAQLTTRQKELIRMRYFEDKSIDEIPMITSLTSRTIYNTLQNAIVKLKDLINNAARQ